MGMDNDDPSANGAYLLNKKGNRHESRKGVQIRVANYAL
jgi:hypothetical protein